MTFYYLLHNAFWERRYRATPNMGHDLKMPTIDCPDCGGWFDPLLFIPIPFVPEDFELSLLLERWPDGTNISLPPTQWKELEKDLRRKAHIPPDTYIEPGATLYPVQSRDGRFFPIIDRLRYHPGTDLVWEDGYFLCYCSSRLKELIESSKFTGATFVPTVIRKVVGRHASMSPIEYWLLTIRRYTKLATEHEVIRSICPTCGRWDMVCQPAIRVDVSQWNGDDFVRPGTWSATIIVTERVKQKFEEERIQSCRFVNVEVPRDKLWPQTK